MQTGKANSRHTGELVVPRVQLKLSSKHPYVIDGTYLDFLLGSAASEPRHLQRFVLVWNVLILLLVLQGICCLGQAQVATNAFGRPS
jgi:hypothetical protein